MNANITPDKKMLERMQDSTLEFFEEWMAFNFAIAFLTTLEYCGFGSKRANELFDDIEKAWRRYDDYDDDNYTKRVVSKELEKRGIDADFIFKKSIGIKMSRQKEKKKAENQEGMTVIQQLEAQKNVEKFRFLKTYLDLEGEK